MLRRLLLALAVVAALTASLAGGALADDALGQHVAACAQEALGQRDNPPAVSCSHDGVTMTFPTFGAMVEHLRAQG